MKKGLLIVLFLNVCFHLHGQTYVTGFGIKLSKKSVAYSYVDKQKDEAYLFVGNTKVVKCSHYDSNFEIKDSMTVVRPEKEFENIAGVTKSDESLSVFWINDENSQLYQQQINFKNKEAKLLKKHNISFSDQKVIQSISTNSKFYLLTISNNSNVLNLYTYDSNGKEAITKIDMGTSGFLNSKNKNVTLFEVLKERINGFDTSFELPLIDNDSPNTLTITAKKRKLFCNDNELYLTIDSNVRFTQLIRINLIDFRFSTQNINQKIDANDSSSNSNSLLVDDVIYQIATDKQNMVFSVSDLKGNLKKEFITNKNDAIAFKNSKIFESTVNSGYNKNKIQNSGQFVTSISKMNLGLSHYQYNGQNLISIGGVSEHVKKIASPDETSYDMGFYFGQFGLMGSLVYVVLFNQTQTNYDFGRDFTYFYVQLDQNFNKQEEEVTHHSLDLIKNFFTFNPSAVFPTVIPLKKANFLGYYKDENKTYTILSYEK